MTIRLSDKREVSGSLTAPKGGYKNPLTPGELQEKFYRLGSSALNEDKLGAIAAAVEHLESSEDIGATIVL
jgi:hypothetical protein